MLSKDAIKSQYLELLKNQALTYVDKLDLVFDVCEAKMQASIQDWAERLSCERQRSNIRAMPSYAFIHYLAHTHFPFDFVECIEDAEQIDRELRFGLVMPVTIHLEQENEPSDYTKINPYVMVVEDVFRLSIDESFEPAINTSQTAEHLADKAFSKWPTELDALEETIYQEIVRCAEAFCMAVSRVAADTLSLQSSKVEELVK